MKKILLLTGISVISLVAAADDLEPKVLDNAYIREVSSNGAYAVSTSPTTEEIRIFDFLNNKDYLYQDGYMPGFGKCVSDNGIVLCSTYTGVYYWQNGEWFDLPLPEYATSTNSANAITPDGSRICGNIGVAEMSAAYDDDVLMQKPCIWNATDEGFGDPVFLPHPELDITGRIPQYIKATDISADGKIIVGEIQDATGFLSPYPIIYKENEEGEWSYEIPHENLWIPEGLKFLPFPGEAPVGPNYEDYLTEEEFVAYYDAIEAYYESGDYNAEYPDFIDFMSEEEKAEYEKALSEYEISYAEWHAEYEAWLMPYDTCVEYAPSLSTNSIRISADGKTYATTVNILDEDSDPMPRNTRFPGGGKSNVWVFDTNSDLITKYDQNDAFVLTYLANNGIAIAKASEEMATDSYILGNGKSTPIVDFMNNLYAPYASWIKENMIFEFETYEYNEESEEYEAVVKEVAMTGRAVATPELETIVLSVENVWDYMTAGNAYIFDMNVVDGVKTLRPVDGEQVIYDLYGRKLKNATAPGIYIINGEKKVVR